MSEDGDVIVEMSWLATTSTEGLQPNDRALKRYFDPRPHEGLFREYGIARQLWIVPISLTPRDGFHVLATRALADFGVAEVKRIPYVDVDLTSDLQGSIVSVTADLFPGDVLVMMIRARLRIPSGASLRQVVGRMQSLRSAKNLPVIDTLFREVALLVRGDRSGDRKSCRYESYFAASMSLPLSAVDLDAQVEHLSAEFAAMLIGATDARLLRPDLVDRIFERSESLNTKALGEYLLINRQGILYVRPRGKYAGPHLNRYARSRDLAKLALYARALLRDDSGFSLKDPPFAEFLASRLQQWIDFPMLVFDVSVSQTLAWERLIQAFLLEDRLRAWLTLREVERTDVISEYARRQPEWWRSR